MSLSKMAHQVSNLVRDIRKKHVGKGPEHITTRFIGTWVICEMRGNLTTFEKFAVHNDEGRRMVHELRTTYIKRVYEDSELRAQLGHIVNAKLVTLLCDFDVDLDLGITVFIFDRPLLLDESDEV
jgi:uncharacterized protein YbcI